MRVVITVGACALAAAAAIHCAAAGQEFGPPVSLPPVTPQPPSAQFAPPAAASTAPTATQGAPTDAASNPAATAPPPAVTDSTTVPSPIEEWFWYQPNYWWGPTWKGSVEVGLNGSAGNSETFSFRVGGNLKRESKTHILSFEAAHARTSADSIDTQNNALGKARLERLLGESRWSLFAAGTAEYDEFKDFDLRLAANAGVGYAFIKSDATKFIGRFGSGVSHEIGGVDDSYTPEAVLGLELEHAFSAQQKLKLSAEYLPEWGDFENFRFVADASYEVVLDEAKNLSLKIGAIDRYDSTPNGREENDLDYLLLLLWKL